MAEQDEQWTLATPLDSEAVAKLYDGLYEPIYRYCLRRLFDRDSAEDAVSATFLAMAQRIREFRGKQYREFRAWLYVIAANQVNQQLRQKLRHERMLIALAQHIRESRGDTQKIHWPILYQAILRLDEQQQHLIALRFFQRLSFAEIAEIDSSREGTVRVRVYRALRQLRPIIERAMDGECVREIDNGH